MFIKYYFVFRFRKSVFKNADLCLDKRPGRFALKRSHGTKIFSFSRLINFNKELFILLLGFIVKVSK